MKADAPDPLADTDTQLRSLIVWAAHELRHLRPSAQLEAELLMHAVLGIARAHVYAYPERDLAAARAELYRDAVMRRRAGEPTAYIAGRCGFHALDLEIDDNVLVPRPETELLVDQLLKRFAGQRRRSVLDLGTGSGAIALAIKHARSNFTVTAVDVSAAALIVARSNGRRLGLSIDWRRSDWFDGVAGMRFDAIVTNPPYVASDDPHMAALAFEPRLALDGGADGLQAVRAIVAGADAHLESGGVLLLEHGRDQAAAVAAIAAQHRFAVIAVERDLGGHERVSVLQASR